MLENAIMSTSFIKPTGFLTTNKIFGPFELADLSSGLRTRIRHYHVRHVRSVATFFRFVSCPHTRLSLLSSVSDFSLRRSSHLPGPPLPLSAARLVPCFISFFFFTVFDFERLSFCTVFVLGNKFMICHENFLCFWKIWPE